MIYAIIPFRLPNEDKLLEKIKDLGTPAYTDEAPKAYFVSYEGTTNQLSDAIGYSEDDEMGTGIVMPVMNRAGYAVKDLWEWMRIHG